MSDAIPPWAYETPEIRPHDPRLRPAAEAERARLAEVLAPWLADGVEHVGSTAVPGLAAKPVIDLMASVRDPGEVVTRAGDRLTADGWCCWRRGTSATARPTRPPRRRSWRTPSPGPGPPAERPGGFPAEPCGPARRVSGPPSDGTVKVSIPG
jgi:GrpB-like predicted nucleotidyltransferase (UPF0157 family)